MEDFFGSNNVLYPGSQFYTSLAREIMANSKGTVKITNHVGPTFEIGHQHEPSFLFIAKIDIPIRTKFWNDYEF